MTDAEKIERYSNNWYALCLAIVKKNSCNKALNQMGITLYENKKKGRKNWKKILTSEVLEIAKKNGLDKNVLMQRMLLGWDLDKAVNTPKLKKGTKTSRKYPEWVYEKAKENNIKISIFYNRIKFGWSYEEACTIPVGKQGEKHRKIACN